MCTNFTNKNNTKISEHYSPSFSAPFDHAREQLEEEEGDSEVSNI